MGGGTDYDVYRFGIAAGMSGWGWHAVDLELVGPRRRATAAARAEGVEDADIEAFSVCGTRSQLFRNHGPFIYGSRLLGRLRCERCGWVVALNRGTVDHEIDLYIADAAGHDAGGLLRQIFTAILADAPPGRDAEAGHRSDLLAHAARHRPFMTVCEQCAESSDAALVHGTEAMTCPQAVVVCEECSFTAGSWAGKRHGVTTGECVVAAPCSALIALADHYGIPVMAGERR